MSEGNNTETVLVLRMVHDTPLTDEVVEIVEFPVTSVAALLELVETMLQPGETEERSLHELLADLDFFCTGICETYALPASKLSELRSRTRVVIMISEHQNLHFHATALPKCLRSALERLGSRDANADSAPG